MKPIAYLVRVAAALFVVMPAFGGARPSSGDGWMYWTERDSDQIHRTRLDGTGDEILFDGLDGVVDPGGVALDVAGDRVYWTSGDGPSSHKVQRGKLDGTGLETPITMPGTNDDLSDIVLDLAGGKMYFAETTSPEGKIWVANLDGSDLQELLAFDSPSALAFDPVTRHLYWGFSPALACGGQAMIQRLNVDDAGRTVENVITGLHVIRAIAVDSQLDWIYWSEPCSVGIKRAHVDGTGAELLMPAESARGIALDAGSEKIYWTRISPDPDMVRRADLPLEDVDDLVTLAVQFPYGIALIPSAPTDPEDLNGDGTVNGIDLAILLGAWGRCPPRGSCPADFNGSGNVNGLDLAMLLAAWG